MRAFSGVDNGNNTASWRRFSVILSGWFIATSLSHSGRASATTQTSNLFIFRHPPIEAIGKGRARQGEQKSGTKTPRHGAFAFNFAGRLAQLVANEKFLSHR
jgi:hypothetical protein